MEKDLGRLKKNDTTDIVLRIDDFGGKKGLTIREFVKSDRYTGFTKAGVRILSENFQRFKEMVNSVTEEDFEGSETEKTSPESKKQGKGQKTLNNKNEGEDEEDLNIDY